MLRAGKAKQLSLYPMGGEVNATANDLLDAHDALYAMNCEYGGNAAFGGIKKSVLSSQIIAPFEEDSRVLWALGMSVTKKDAPYQKKHLYVARLRNDTGEREIDVAVWDENDQRWEWRKAYDWHSRFPVHGNYVVNVGDRGNVVIDPYLRDDTDRYAYLFGGRKRGVYDETEQQILVYEDKFDSNTNITLGTSSFRMRVSSLDVNAIGDGSANIPYGYYAFVPVITDTNGCVSVGRTELVKLYDDGYYGENSGYFRVNVPEWRDAGSKFCRIFRSTKLAEAGATDDEVQDALQTCPFYEIKELSGGLSSFLDTDTDEEIMENDYIEHYLLAGRDFRSPGRYVEWPFYLPPPQNEYYGFMHQNRLYVVSADNPNVLHWSMTNRLRNFLGGFISFGNEIITGGASIYGYAIIFTDNAIYSWYGHGEAQMNANKPMVISNSGLSRFTRTIQTWGNRVLFIDDDGIAKQIVDNRVVYLSNNPAKKKIYIPGGRLRSTVINEKYLVSNGENEFSCNLATGGQWSRHSYSPQEYVYGLQRRPAETVTEL